MPRSKTPSINLEEAKARFEEWPTGRAMAGLLSVFAEFEHEILRERIRAGIVEARRKGTKLGWPVTAAKKAGQIRKLHRCRHQQSRDRPLPRHRPHLGPPNPG
jgi:DNA invertase Pin-like site-specific DNA recombinase